MYQTRSPGPIGLQGNAYIPENIIAPRRRESKSAHGIARNALRKRAEELQGHNKQACQRMPREERVEPPVVRYKKSDIFIAPNKNVEDRRRQGVESCLFFISNYANKYVTVHK